MCRKIPFLLSAVLTFVPWAGFAAEQIWINDIQVNPSRYWNTTVTVVGQVLETTPNPAGTTRGIYMLLDDSTPDAITVRTKDLPPVGKVYAVTGVVIQDPASADAPLIRELKRSAPGMSPLLRYSLIAGSALFVILLVVFFALLVKPRGRPEPQVAAMAKATEPRAVPVARPVTRAPEPGAVSVKTTKLPTGPPGVDPGTDKTQVFMSLGAELIVERGPDKDKEYPLHKQVTTIGRAGSRKNDVELSDDTVSKEQASIFFDTTSRQFTIANQSQTNATMVNQLIVTEGKELEDGDLVEMGRTAIRFERS